MNNYIDKEKLYKDTVNSKSREAYKALSRFGKEIDQAQKSLIKDIDFMRKERLA